MAIFALLGTGYFPTFPASNPYVTAVGATMGAEGGSVVPRLGQRDQACQVRAYTPKNVYTCIV